MFRFILYYLFRKLYKRIKKDQKAVKSFEEQIGKKKMVYMGKQGLVGTNGEVGQIPEKGGN